MEISEIESSLSVLERRVDALGESQEPPKTLLRVIHESQKERAWHLLLAYFIDPMEPHQFDTDVLDQFLQCLSDHPENEFSYQAYELESVSVDTEVSADDGRPDLLVWVPDSWFICIEIKVGASETNQQTKRYVASDELGDIAVSEYPSDSRHYIYLADRRAGQSAASAFVDVAWQDVTTALDELRTSGLATYPARSGAQLTEFLDHSKRELHMTDDTASYYDKAELAIDHQSLLDELDAAVDQAVEDMQASWDTEFLKDPPKGWTDEWIVVRRGNKYGRILKSDWLLETNTENKPQKTSGFSIAFPTELHRRNIENGQTAVKFRVFGDNEFSDRYEDRFYNDEFQAQIAPVIDKYELNINDRNSKSQLLKTPYSFEFAGGSGYQKALKQAFQEHLELVPHLEELYFDIREDIDDYDALE